MGKTPKDKKCCRCGDYPAYRKDPAGNHYCIRCFLDTEKR